MRSCLPIVAICFHDVKLWAVCAANLVCVAIVVSLATLDIVSIPVLAWHADLVECAIAAALLATQVDIERDGAI